MSKVPCPIKPMEILTADFKETKSVSLLFKMFHTSDYKTGAIH